MAARSWHHLMPPPAQWGGYCLYAIDLCMLSLFEADRIQYSPPGAAAADAPLAAPPSGIELVIERGLVIVN